MKKTIYLVRHGESEGNVSETGNMNHSPLTEKGRKQAEFLAKRCRDLDLKTIVASPLERAKETAQIIASSIKMDIEFSELFVEKRNPSAVLGKVIETPDQQVIWRALWDNFHIPGFKHSDEENFAELKNRAQKAMDYLASRPEEKILVVSHGVFLRALMALVILGTDLDGRECRQFMALMETHNTGLSVLKYNNEDRFGRTWVLSVWNDHEHLKEL